MKIRSTGSQLGTSFGDWFCALFENKRSGDVTQELSLPRTGGGLRAPAAHGVSSIHNIVISYLAKYEPLAFRRLKVRKNFGNSSSLIFKWSGEINYLLVQ